MRPRLLLLSLAVGLAPAGPALAQADAGTSSAAPSATAPADTLAPPDDAGTSLPAETSSTAAPASRPDTDVAQSTALATQAAQLRVQAERIQELQAQLSALQSQLTAVQSQLAEAQGTANAAQAQLQDQAQARADAEAARQDRFALLDQASQAVAQAGVRIDQGVPDDASAQVADAQSTLATAAASAGRYANPREATAEQTAVHALATAQAQLDSENGMYAKQSLSDALVWIAQARALAATPQP